MKLLFAAAGGALLLGAANGGGATPHGSRIAFGLERGTLSSIYTVRPNGTGLRRLTVPPTRQDLGGDSGPTWSPDGKRIAFERDLPYWGDDRFHLASVAARGGIARGLTRGPYDAMPTFSPDGRRIAFVRLDSTPVDVTVSLFTVDRRGRRVAPLLATGIDISPAWSPDGATIAFSRLADSSLPIEEAALYLAAADGSNVRSLGDPPLRGVSPAWSPDGRKLAFIAFDGRNAACPADSCPSSGDLFVADADGSDVRQLTASTADDEHPTWSPDGSRIAFASGFDLRSQGHPPWLVTVPAGGGRLTRIGRFSGVLDPAWSPAGVR